MAGGESIIERRKAGALRAVAPWADPIARPLVPFRERLKALRRNCRGRPAYPSTSTSANSSRLLGPSGCGKTTLLAAAGGLRDAERGTHRARRGRHRRRAAASSARQHDVSELRAVSASYRRRQRRVRSQARRTAEGRDQRARRADACPRSSLAILPNARSTSSPAASSNASRWHGRWSSVRKVLLLDEPLAALDRKLREETRFELMALQKELGLTFIIVTHDREEAMTVADRVAVMERGKISQVGTPAEIYEQPRSRFVADFIGDVNVIQGRVASVSDDGAVIEVVDAGRLAWPTPVRASRAISRGSRCAPKKSASLTICQRCRARTSCRGMWPISPIWATCRSTRSGWTTGSSMRATVANLTRLVERPIGWEDRVWLSWPPGAGILLTR